MGKKKKRPNEFKYGMALYGAAWPSGDYYYVCGGGGMGLVPRIVWAQYKNGECTDQKGEFPLGKDTPMRMLMCPWGASLLLGNADGGIRRLQIGFEGPNNSKPKLVEVSAAFQEVMSDLTGEVGTMTFNTRGNLLAVGFKENGGIKVISYPSMKTLVEWRLQDPEVKDVDWCHAPGLQQELLAAVASDGTCQLWGIGQEGVKMQAQLEPPKGDKPKFIRCRFARNSQGLLLYVMVNMRASAGSYLAAYASEGPGKPWQLVKKVKAHDQLASAMDISQNGHWVAVGFADGALRVFGTDNFTVVKSEPVASIAFVSSVVFNADNNAVLAVGGDANCYVMELVPRQSNSGPGFWFLLLLLLLGASAMALLHYWQNPHKLPYVALQQLQQLSKQEHITQACSNGSFLMWQQVCGWVQRAAQILPEERLFDQHDEL